MAEHTTGETVIGTDAVIKGEMSVESSARILGTFEGTIRSKGRIQVADKAQCRAAVQAGVVHVDGNLEGDITATDKAELNATARVKGDLVAPKLIVMEGAAFVGHVSVGPDAVKGAPKSGAPEGKQGDAGGAAGGSSKK